MIVRDLPSAAIDVKRPTLGLPWGVLLVLPAAAALILVHAYLAAMYFNGSPFDGAFQHLNSLRRLDLGQLPGKDFVLFHGIGLMLVHLPLFEGFGRDLFASELSRQLISPTLLFGAVTALVYSMTRSRPLALGSAALLILALLLLGNLIWLSPTRVWPVPVMPGVSLNVLRWSVPACCGIGLVWMANATTAPTRRAILCGLLFGAAILWSTEQAAYAVAAAVVFVMATRLQKREFFSTSQAIAFVVTVFVTVLSIVGIAVAFGLEDQFRYAYVDIPQNQGWYFGAPPNQSIAVNGVGTKLLAHLLLLLALAGCWYFAQRAATRSKLDRARAVVSGFLCLYALLSSASYIGYLTFSYSVPAAFSLYVVAMGQLHAVVHAARWRMTATVAAATIGMGMVLANAVAESKVWQEGIAQAASQRALRTATGGYALGVYGSLVPVLAAIEHDSETRLFSTYRSLLSEELNQPPWGRVDYIIHALGEREWKDYLRTFDALSPRFVETRKPEGWDAGSLQTVHWDFYRRLVERYRVLGDTGYNLLWEARDTPVPLSRKNCGALERAQDGALLLPRVSSRDSLLEVTISYRAVAALGDVPIASGLPRFLIEHDGLANALPIPLNPRQHSTAWIVGRADQPGKLRPRAYSPLPGNTLSVDSAMACEITIPEDAMRAFAYLTAAAPARKSASEIL